MKRIIMYFMMVLMITSFAYANILGDDYSFDGNSIIYDTTDVYMKTTPHTLTKSGIVSEEFISKQFSGNVDIAFGINSDNVSIKEFYIKKINETYNSENDSYTNITWYEKFSNIQKINYNYDGLDTWYVVKDVNINSNKSYEAQFYLDFKGSGKYGIAMKPSSETIAQAITNNHFLYKDPWYNDSSHQNDFSLEDDGSSELKVDWTGRLRLPFSYEDNIVSAYLFEDISDVDYTVNGATGYKASINGRGVPAFDFEYLESDYSEIDDNSKYSFTDGSGNDEPFSFSIWIQQESTAPSVFGVVLSKYDGASSREYYIGIDTSNQVLMDLHNNAIGTNYIGFTSDTTITNGEITNIIVNYDGSETNSGFSVYINNIESNISVRSGGAYTGMSDSTSPVYIGARGSSGTPEFEFDGLIIDTRIYNKTLNSTERTELYNNGYPKYYDESVATSNQVLHLDMQSGLDSVGSNEATINGATFTNNGKIGGAYDFDGTNDYIQTPITENSDFIGDDGFSIILDLYLDDKSYSQRMISKGGSQVGSQVVFVIQYDAGVNSLVWQIASGSTRYNVLGSDLNTGEYYSIVATWDKSEIELFINNVSQGTTNVASINDIDYNILIGAIHTSTVGSAVQSITLVDGIIDEVYIINRTLNSTEISALYNSGVSRRYNESLNEFFSAVNTSNVTFNQFKANLSCIAETCEARVSSDNGTTWSEWFNSSQNGQNISISASGNTVKYQFRLVGNATYTPLLDNFYISSLSFIQNMINNSYAIELIKTAINTTIGDVTLYENQKVYTYDGTHKYATMDVFLKNNNKYIGFNYVTDNETETNISGIGETLSVWENSSLNNNELTDQVTAFINSIFN